MVRILHKTSWPKVPDRPLVIVPLGSVEQHGPHLPLDVDSVIADAVAQRLVEELTVQGACAVLAPTIPYGASGEHQTFPGTVSIGTESLTLVLTELGRSACQWAAGIVFICGHGGNLEAVVRAVEVLRNEDRLVLWTACSVLGGDAHAGQTETSIMLALDPSAVQVEHLVAGNTEPLSALMPRLRKEGVRGVSPNGVLGDARNADATQGRLLLDAMATRAYDDIMASLPWRMNLAARDGRA